MSLYFTSFGFKTVITNDKDEIHDVLKAISETTYLERKHVPREPVGGVLLCSFEFTLKDGTVKDFSFEFDHSEKLKTTANRIISVGSHEDKEWDMVSLYDHPRYIEYYDSEVYTVFWDIVCKYDPSPFNLEMKGE